MVWAKTSVFRYLDLLGLQILGAFQVCKVHNAWFLGATADGISRQLSPPRLYIPPWYIQRVQVSNSGSKIWFMWPETSN